MRKRIIHIQSSGHGMKLIILEPKKREDLLPGILWIHGGGYTGGTPAMVLGSCAHDLAKRYGAVVISPGYRLAGEAPYPAAFEDCCAALEYMWDHAEELGIDRERIVVGGESAGGGLAAAVCLYARDEGKVKVAMQLPLYPMLDCEDTDSSRDNHGKNWNTEKNHEGWRIYLGELWEKGSVPPYASPSRETDYKGLPPCYTYVCEGEPFYCETLEYVRRLNEAGVPAKADVFPGNVHAFDLVRPWRRSSKEAKKKRAEAYEKVILRKK